MNQAEIRSKFGDDYTATEVTFRLGIDIRLTRAMAERFAGNRVLETCTGAGFTTIALADAAAHVITIEVDPVHQGQARANVLRAQLLDKVTFILGDAMSDQVLDLAASIDSAFLDPDWAVTGSEHIYRFRHSNMRPPADALLEKCFVGPRTSRSCFRPTSTLGSWRAFWSTSAKVFILTASTRSTACTSAR